MLKWKMAKWKILIWTIMFMTIISVAQAGFFINSDGGERNSGGGIFSAIKNFFTTPSVACVESWTSSVSTCQTNDTTLTIYTDSNSCGTTGSLPADNGTFNSWCNYCSYNLVITDLTECFLNDGNETQNVTVFDSNFPSCCNVTALSSDCYRADTTNFNKTYFETRVCEEGGSQMWDFAIIILPFLFGLFLIIGSATLGEDHTAAKIFMFLLSFVTIFTSMHYASIIAAYRLPALTELQDAVGNTIYWAGRIFFVLVLYFLIYGFTKIVHRSAQKKKERLQY